MKTWTLLLLLICVPFIFAVDSGVDEFLWDGEDELLLAGQIQPVVLAAELCTIGACQTGTFTPETRNPAVTTYTFLTTSWTTEFTTFTQVTQQTLTTTSTRTITTTITDNALSVTVRTVFTTIPLTFTAHTSLTRYVFSDDTVTTTVTATTMVFTSLSFSLRTARITTTTSTTLIRRSTVIESFQISDTTTSTIYFSTSTIGTFSTVTAIELTTVTTTVITQNFFVFETSTESGGFVTDTVSLDPSTRTQSVFTEATVTVPFFQLDFVFDTTTFTETVPLATATETNFFSSIGYSYYI
jgi:hypothetical protein